jgi:DUF1680 family protein
LLKLDIDSDFLRPFRERKSRSGYIGRGNTIDAAVRFATYTGNKNVVVLKDYLVEETIKSQEADGYIGMMVPENRMFRMWDIHEMAYIVNGLVSDYKFFKEPRSLEAAGKLADYIIKHWSEIPKDWDRRTKIRTHVSVTGLERALIWLAHSINSGNNSTDCD